jgi:hypothetical protein
MEGSFAVKRKKIAVIAGIILLLLSAFSTLFVIFLSGLTAPKTDETTPHYLTYQGSQSKIYMISSSSTFTLINQTYTSEAGQQIAQGSHLFTIDLTLRNDYSSENPPPSTGTQTAPIEGTAYILLKTTLLDNDVTVPTINLSQSDFSVPSSDETALVLASGQTNTIQLLLATNQTKISGFLIDITSLSDSIPR